MNDDELFSSDELRIEIPITRRSTGLPLGLADVTEADFRAVVGRPGEAGTLGTVAIVDPAAGIIAVSFQEGALRAPQSSVHVRLTRGGETQTVFAKTYRVTPSVLSPA